MRRLLLLLTLLSSFVHADVSTTENDPSSFTDNVNVITGKFYSFIEDYTVQGYEPIHIRRSFVSGGDHLVGNDWLIAAYFPRPGIFSIPEPNGSRLAYEYANEKRGDALVFKVVKIGSQAGTTNTARGTISAQTNLDNQYLVADPGKTPFEKFTLFCANGTKRHYLKLERQIKQKLNNLSGQSGYLAYYYKLLWEELPNGNQRNYFWDHHNQLTKITTSPRENTALTFASLQRPSQDLNRFSPREEFFGSDRRYLLYETTPVGKDTKKKDVFSLRWVHSPDFPKLGYNYFVSKDTPFLELNYLPNGRQVRIEYEGQDQSRRVSKMFAPVGKDASLVLTHRFSYDMQGRNSHVHDAYNNRTSYFWNDQLRLTEIQRYRGEQRLFSIERFCWDESRIKAKAHLNERGEAIFARSFDYDGPGNVRQEIFWGNLSGEGSPLHLQGNYLLYSRRSQSP